MARRGLKRRLDLESGYWLLLAAGIGTVEACRLLGIGRKTGYRWRAENGGLAPARLGEGVRSNRYLSLLERQRIEIVAGLDRLLGKRLRHSRHPSSEDGSSQIRCQPNSGQTRQDDSSGRRCEAATSSRTSSVMWLIVSCDNSVPDRGHQMVLDVADRHPTRIQAGDHLVEATEARQ